jgi:hypothetical protein
MKTRTDPLAVGAVWAHDNRVPHLIKLQAATIHFAFDVISPGKFVSSGP